MDQVAALHWIQVKRKSDSLTLVTYLFTSLFTLSLQENIREFGGDERNVTVMGHGTGAACVNFLMLSPMARGKWWL